MKPKFYNKPQLKKYQKKIIKNCWIINYSYWGIKKINWEILNIGVPLMDIILKYSLILIWLILIIWTFITQVILYPTWMGLWKIQKKEKEKETQLLKFQFKIVWQKLLANKILLEILESEIQIFFLLKPSNLKLMQLIKKLTGIFLRGGLVSKINLY